tara:strand:- start:9665 stop:11053 length:1389 start_codon:yes stop_codon:yes gene_type:complete
MAFDLFHKLHSLKLNVALRIGGLCLCLLALVWVARHSQNYAIMLLLGGAVVIQFLSLMNKLTRTDREIIRFLDAVKYADFSQKFSTSRQGGSQADLGQAFDDVVGIFRKTRVHHEEQTRYLRALVDHIPVALLSVTPSGEAKLVNNAAKRLFGLSHIRRISDLDKFGPALVRELTAPRAGKKRLLRITVDDMDVKLFCSITTIVVGGQTSSILSLQNIQSELDTTQIEAWQDLVHVLTHELMNSLTPVASLSHTLDSLMTDVSEKARQEEVSDGFRDLLQDASDGIGAIARRSNRLNNFVSTYRKMTKVPPPKEQHLQISSLFDNIEKLFSAPLQDGGITLEKTVIPDSLAVLADPELLDQALINLVKNAVEVLSGREDAILRLTARLDRNGAPQISVSDNGPGIDPEIAHRIFVPFFTTKHTGSGVGLSLVRQIMLAHKGSVSCHPNPDSGVSFRLSGFSC